MIDADALHEAEQQALGQLATMDLSLAARLHSLAMSAEGTKQILELTHGYQRAGRGVRQTIMLRAKLRENRERHLLDTAPLAAPRPPSDLQEAAERILAQAQPDRPRAERLDALDRIDAWIDQEIEDHEDFGEDGLDEHVLALCRACNLPEDLARRFRDLPRAPREDGDTDPRYTFEAMSPPPRRETG